MTGFDTLRTITDNMRAVLEAEGLHVARDRYDGGAEVPSSLFPYCILLYEGESFEYTHGQRPGYSEAHFTVEVSLWNRDLAAMVEDEERWVHRVRGALTVAALNTGAIASTVPVSRVETRSVKVERKGHVSRLACQVAVRYR